MLTAPGMWPAAYSSAGRISITADLLGIWAVVWLIAAITAASGVIVSVRMFETHADRAGAELLAPLLSRTGTTLDA